MISYDNLWDTMGRKSITKYKLIYHYGFSSNTLRRIAKGEAINTSTLNQLCLILDCGVEDIITFKSTEEEKKEIEELRIQTLKRYKKRP